MSRHVMDDVAFDKADAPPSLRDFKLHELHDGFLRHFLRVFRQITGTR